MILAVALAREEIGRRIKVAREGAGLSQRELADAVNLRNAQDISRYERGKVAVPDFRIDLIAEATGRSRSYFTRDPDEPDVEEIAGTLRTIIREELADVVAVMAVAERLLERLAEQEAGDGTRAAER